MVASRFEAENPEDQAKGQPRSGTLDRAEDVRLGGDLGQSAAVEVELGHSKQGQQKPNDGGENSSSAVELGDDSKSCRGFCSRTSTVMTGWRPRRCARS